MDSFWSQGRQQMDVNSVRTLQDPLRSPKVPRALLSLFKFKSLQYGCQSMDSFWPQGQCTLTISGPPRTRGLWGTSHFYPQIPTIWAVSMDSFWPQQGWCNGQVFGLVTIFEEIFTPFPRGKAANTRPLLFCCCCCLIPLCFDSKKGSKRKLKHR